jgi:hypothetical protein
MCPFTLLGNGSVNTSEVSLLCGVLQGKVDYQVLPETPVAQTSLYHVVLMATLHHVWWGTLVVEISLKFETNLRVLVV